MIFSLFMLFPAFKYILASRTIPNNIIFGFRLFIAAECGWTSVSAPIKCESACGGKRSTPATGPVLKKGFQAVPSGHWKDVDSFGKAIRADASIGHRLMRSASHCASHCWPCTPNAWSPRCDDGCEEQMTTFTMIFLNWTGWSSSS